MGAARPLGRAWWAAPAVLVLAWALAVALAGPGRQMLPEDDGWAYARSVQVLLDGGRLQLDAWTAASMPVQILLGAAACLLTGGFSFAALEATTLALLLVGLLALYGLLREAGLGRIVGTVAAAAWLAVPGVLPLAFSFMSDVQFIGWLLLALWTAVRGLRGGPAWWLAAGVAAMAAIGTRQFGLALLPALALGGALAWRAGRLPAGWLLAALAPPLAMALWQLVAGAATPTYTQAVRIVEQRWYVGLPLPQLAAEVAWRLGALVRYLGLLSLPLLPWLGWLALRPVPGARPQEGRRGAVVLLSVLAGLLVLVALVALARWPSYLRRPWPAEPVPPWLWHLPLHWLLPNLLRDARAVEAALAASSFALALGGLAVAWRQGRRAWRDRTRVFGPGALVGATGGVLLGLHLAYVQFNDTYLLGLLPLAWCGLLAPGNAQRPPRAVLAATAVVAVGMMVGTALWQRGERNAQEAVWRAADALRAGGLPASRIAASRHWSEYHGAFDDWLASVGQPQVFDRPPSTVAFAGDLHGPFYAWLDAQGRQAEAWVARLDGAAPPGGWVVVGEQPYRDAVGRWRAVQVLRRVP